MFTQALLFMHLITGRYEAGVADGVRGARGQTCVWREHEARRWMRPAWKPIMRVYMYGWADGFVCEAHD
jgi:hypothetical protein